MAPRPLQLSGTRHNCSTQKKNPMDSEDKSTTELYKGGYSQRGRGHARESSCNVIRCYFISISTSTGTAINFIHWNFQPLPRLLCPTQPAQPVLAANTNAFCLKPSHLSLFTSTPAASSLQQTFIQGRCCCQCKNDSA